MKVVDNSTSGSHRNFGFKDGTNPRDDYRYDENGNMTQDLNKDIYQISYNHLNLPVEIRFDLANSIPRINYVYDATGTKLSKTVVDEGTIKTEYAGNFIYNNAGGSQMTLQFFNHPEGYVEPVMGEESVKGFEVGLPGPTYSSYKYVFQYKDHLGNVRLSYSDLDLNGAIDPNTEIISEKNYYPFGLQHKGYNNVINGTEHPYTYNGKEEQNELGLNWLDYGARNYDAALGRWMNVDPLAEHYYNNTPYNYVNNNPLNFIDPDGRSGIAAIKKDEDGNEYVEVSAKIYFYGDQSSDKFATSTASNIQKMWNDAGGTIEIDGKSYSVKFSISGEHVTEEQATKLAEENGGKAENNFIRVTDGADLDFKSSFFDTPGNSGLFIASEMKNGSTDAHEFGHGLGWYEAGEIDGGRHDYTVDDGIPGIMSPRGTPVSDEYGYGGQPSGSKTMSPYRRKVLASDVTKLNIDAKALQTNGKVNVGTATNNIYNTNGTVKN